LATNIAKHAADGQILVHEVAADEGSGVEVLAIDRGPGLPAQALDDGFSTAGSLGAGLGSIQRQADAFEIFTRPGSGSVVVARVWKDATVRTPRSSFCAVSIPKPGEAICGDAWGHAVHAPSGRRAFIVADGLGHGPLAAEAATTAIRLFATRHAIAPVDLIHEIHLALRATRGAAVALAVVDREREVIRFTGLGNVAASLVSPDLPRQSLASHNGTAGVALRTIQEFVYPLRAGMVLVMHSDGLATRWMPESYPGLWGRDPALAAGALYRDHARGRDDCTVLVAPLS
jgi:hypothetical protein